MRPIDYWPDRPKSRRSGPLAPQDDPLRVASRIVDQRLFEAVADECRRRREAGAARDGIEQFRDAMLGLNGPRFVAWEWLCGSFDAVAAVFEAELATNPAPYVRAILRQVRRAKKESAAR